MGQFKPMVKMETTEPSVILKLKKGGAVKKAEGGHMGMPSGTPSSMATSMARGGSEMSQSPAKPSMADRKKAMSSNYKEGGEVPHMKLGGALSKMMKKIAPKIASVAKAPAPMNKSVGPMGKAVMGLASDMKTKIAQPAMKFGSSGMKEGGKADKSQDKAMIKKAFKQHDMQEHKGGKGTTLSLKKGGKAYATGGVVKGQGGYATGGVVDGQGGYATGGVVNGQGGYKKGGAAKKAYATGGSVNSGAPVAMPQGNKKPQKPIRINELTGVYKKGGSVKKMASGGESSKDSSEKDAIISREMARKNAEKSSIAKENEEMRDSILGAPGRLIEGAKRFLKPSILPSGSVTKTEKSVTVDPGKKRGGEVC
jgi:hypothetical protein